MKVKIKDVVFQDYNQQDNLHFTIDKTIYEVLEDTPIYSNSMVLHEGTMHEGTLWVKIWECGIAQYGFTQKCDPLHAYKEYTWSSNTDTINDYFGLHGTPFKLARFGAGIMDCGAGIRDCNTGFYWAGNLTVELAMKLAKEHEDKLKYGLDNFVKTIS